jgi:hypothetical protein
MPNGISFTPTSPEQLSGYIGLLNTKTSEIKVAESDFKFNDSVDGIKGRGTSKEENALYASIVFGENKTAVMDGIYYFKRCILNNKNNSGFYNKGFITLCNTATKAFGVTDEEINEISIRAHYDHFSESNTAAKKLIADGREDLIVTVARAYVTGSSQDKNEIVNKAIDLASQVPIPASTYKHFGLLASVLVDPELQKALLIILNKAKVGDGSFKTVTIASAQN